MNDHELEAFEGLLDWFRSTPWIRAVGAFVAGFGLIALMVWIGFMSPPLLMMVAPPIIVVGPGLILCGLWISICAWRGNGTAAT